MNFTVPLSYNTDLDNSQSNPVFFCKACNHFSFKRFGEKTDLVLREPEPGELSLFEFVEVAFSLSTSCFVSQRKLSTSLMQAHVGQFFCFLGLLALVITSSGNSSLSDRLKS